MESGNTKLVVGLIIGAAVGAAIGAFLASDKKDEMLGNINEVAHKAKLKIGDAISKGIEELDSAVDKVNAIAHSAIARTANSELK